jgi:hypothetical protein
MCALSKTLSHQLNKIVESVAGRTEAVEAARAADAARVGRGSIAGEHQPPLQYWDRT